MLEARVGRLEHLPRSRHAQCHLGGAVEFFFEYVPNFTERVHGAPTGLQLAGTRDAVALALDAHVVFYELESTSWSIGGGGRTHS